MNADGRTGGPVETSWEVRRLGRDDGEVIRRLATAEPRVGLLDDDRTIVVAAFAGGERIGLAFGHVLPRRHGDASILFVYEVAVEEAFRRLGVATSLLRTLRAEAGPVRAFVLTEPANDAANALYRSLGGKPEEQVLWRFD